MDTWLEQGFFTWQLYQDKLEKLWTYPLIILGVCVISGYYEWKTEVYIVCLKWRHT